MQCLERGKSPKDVENHAHLLLPIIKANMHEHTMSFLQEKVPFFYGIRVTLGQPPPLGICSFQRGTAQQLRQRQQLLGPTSSCCWPWNVPAIYRNMYINVYTANAYISTYHIICMYIYIYTIYILRYTCITYIDICMICLYIYDIPHPYIPTLNVDEQVSKHVPLTSGIFQGVCFTFWGEGACRRR